MGVDKGCTRAQHAQQRQATREALAPVLFRIDCIDGSRHTSRCRALAHAHACHIGQLCSDGRQLQRHLILLQVFLIQSLLTCMHAKGEQRPPGGGAHSRRC